MLKKIKTLSLLLLSIILFFISVGCKSEPSSSASDTPKPQVTNYTVTFIANGGSGAMPAQTFAKDETKALSENTFTRTNKVFTGWNTKADGTGTPYTDAQNYTATGNITLYAQWADVAFVVTFNKNDGSGEKVTQPFAVGIAQNLKANTFTITDKVFTGWNTNADGTGRTYTDGQNYTATADITLYAQWRDLYIYTVTFEKNDGSGTKDMQTFREGQTQNLKAFASMFTTPDAMNFVGLNTKADGTGISYTDGQSYTATSDITFYAQWDFAYLCFTAQQEDSEVHIQTHGMCSLPSLQCSTDGLYWTGFGGYGGDITLTNVGDKLYVRGNNSTFSKNVNDYIYFFIRGKVSASGNIMSLVDETCRSTTIPCSCCFLNLFKDCRNLTTAPELPATTLTSGCYASMFYGCTSLETAPELPATTLANECYDSMFYGCTSLKTAPEELPATDLTVSCYKDMFSGCTSLLGAPALPATGTADYCCSGMFRDCSSLVDAPKKLPARWVESYCYEFMFSGCLSLETAPELPATVLEVGCYRNMFGGCMSLVEAPKLPASNLSSSCYFSMFGGCSSLKTIPELPCTRMQPQCYMYMFVNCTSLKFSETQTADCPYRYSIPSTYYCFDSSATWWNKGMFENTTGTFTEDPRAQKIYYTNATVI